MKKVVLSLNLYDDKAKQKAMKVASSVSGINSIAMNMNEKKMTVIGEMDPINIVGKLRKYWHTEIDFIGPPEEPKAPELEKKEEKKKDEAAVKIAKLIKAIELGGGYNYPYMTSHYHLESIAEENPNACCVIS